MKNKYYKDKNDKVYESNKIVTFLVLKSQEFNCIIYKWMEVDDLGNIIKINMYVEAKRKKNDQLKLANVEKAILEYNNWIKMTNREDKIESYEIFLQG